MSACEGVGSGEEPSMTEPHPVVICFPFLDLTRPIEFGTWWLGPVSQFEGPWLSAEFEMAARKFVGSFRKASGDLIAKPAILVRRDGGADGQPPTREERQAIELAIGFGVIDQNPFWSPETEHSSWKVGTTDNADFWVQPLDPDGWIALGTGSRVETTTGGLNLQEQSFFVPAPLELHMPFGITLDREMVEAIYAVLTTPGVEHEDTAARIRVALRWLLKSWQNTPNITWEDRLVFVKIATEAITGEEQSYASATKLEALFASAAEQEGESVGTDDLLWQPGQPGFDREYGPAHARKVQEVSAFVHWGCALGDARNALVHGEDGTSHNYEQQGSPYEGSFVEVGDRVVREALAVLLGRCGFPAVWRRESRTAFHVWRRLTTDDEGDGG